jgi:hypothetical protein
LRKAIDLVRNINNENARVDFAREFDAAEVMNGYVEWVEGVMRCKKDWGTTRGLHAE